MAINFTDFTDPRLRAQNKFEGVSELLPNILEGYKAARTPETMDTDLALKRAQTIKALREAQEGNPLTSYARTASDMQKLLNDPNASPEAKRMAQQLYDLDVTNTQSIMENRQSLLQWRPYGMLEKKELSDVNNKYRGVGVYDQQQQQQAWNNGWTPEVIQSYTQQGLPINIDKPLRQFQGQGQGQGQSQGQGVKPSTILPPVTNKQGIPTEANQTDIMKNEGYVAESEYLAKTLDDYGADYTQRVGNVSPQYYYDTYFKEDTPENRINRAKFIAGQIMGPDRALIATTIAGASNAHAAVSELMQRMGANAKVLNITKDKEVMKEALELVRKDLHHAARLRIEGMKGTLPSQNVQPGVKQPEQVMSSAIAKAQNAGTTPQPKGNQNGLNKKDVDDILKFAQEVQ